MSGIQRYRNELVFYDVLSYVLSAYQEVAFMRMNTARSDVLACRSFLDELRHVYREIQISHYRELLRLTKQQKSEVKEKKEVVVLMSPREKLQGDIPQHVFYEFAKYIEHRNDVTIFVVGSVGEVMFKARFPNRAFQAFELLFGDTFEEDLLNLAFLLQDYDVVSIFHGQFQTLLTQEVVSTSLEKYVDASDAHIGGGNVVRTDFLFEPDLPKVKGFFDTQFRSASLRQSVHESRLAQFASRARAMDEALQNTSKSRKNAARQLLLAKKASAQKKQLSQLASVLWSSGG